jgi:type VI protein secretion system component VasF
MKGSIEMDTLLQAYVWVRTLAAGLGRDERGEGVISTAIAVLIMAALGAVMWVGFQAIWGNASSQTTNQINQIGAP